MKTNTLKGRKNARLSGALAVICGAGAVMLAPLGSFAVWVLGGATIFFAFLAVFHLIPPAPPPKKFSKKKKLSPAEEATRAHIAYHLPLVISLLLGGVLLAVVVLFFFG